MRILHAFSNWKWTGPAEPAVRLAAALRRHAEVEFACGKCPYPDLENLVAKAARDAGLPLLDGLRLRKHFDPWHGARDYRRLRELYAERSYSIVHSHLLNDHLLLGAAARRTVKGPLIVRTLYGGRDLGPRIRTALAFSRLVDGVVCASASVAADVARRTRVPKERIAVFPGAVDLDRFAPAQLARRRAAARKELGCDDEHVVFGIVARVQRHRRFDLLFESFALAARADSRLRLVVVGRGTRMDRLAHRPVAKLGIKDRVVFPGYREGERYVSVLAALDAGIFLVPGSDGSCRAARELAACGLPLVVTPRAPLPEIVGDGECGIVASEDKSAFAAAFTALGSDAPLRERLGAAARARATDRFSLASQADAVFGFYRRLLELGPWQRRS